MKGYRWPTRIAAVLGLTVGLAVAPAATALADVASKASTPASCMGIEAAALSPPGSSDEAEGGAKDLHTFIVATFPGTPPGQIVRVISSLHEGSHVACDEALEG